MFEPAARRLILDVSVETLPPSRHEVPKDAAQLSRRYNFTSLV